MCVCMYVCAYTQAFLKLAKTPLIKHSDMVEEMRVEAVEISVSGTYMSVPKRVVHTQQSFFPLSTLSPLSVAK